MSAVAYLAMSDEEWLKSSIPTSGNDGAVTTAPEVVTTEETSTTVPDSVTTDPVTTAEEPDTTETSGVGETNTATETISTDTQTESQEQTQQEQTDAAIQAEIDYKAAYERLTTPFKANGREIQVKDVDDAIQLMQMGANYTKKMQELQPHKKLLLMLQNNNLLDEGKLAFYIDVEKKNPEAIKKLIKDSGIDPLDIDINTASAYVEGGHRVSDAEVTFNTALEDLSSKPGGTELLAAIDKTWDPVSKQAAWDNPDILAIIHEQQVAGIYGQIVAEMDRQKTLGKIPATTPFIRAYKEVGDELLKANSLTGSPATTPVPTPPKVLATRIAAPKSPVTNGDKAGAAASTRAAPVVAQTQPNYLAMSDDEFMKSMEGRL